MADITLRLITADDIEQMRLWRNSPEVAQYMYTDQEITAEQQMNWYNQVKTDKTKKYWIIEYNGQDKGVASLYNINEQFKSCYWAFYLGDSSARGAGIGAKVEYNVITHVFEDMNFNKLLCEVFVSNDKVIKMHEKFGFRRESYFREHILKNSEYSDVVGLALLKRDWALLKDNYQRKLYG